MSILYLGILSLALVLSLTYMVYLLYAIVSAAPFVPTSAQPMRTMLRLAQIHPGERVVDVGSGDGRLVLAAADIGAEALGIEINPILYVWSVIRAKVKRQSRAAFCRANFWHTDLARADVLMVYCLPGKMERLEKKIKKEMQPGARIVVHAFPFPSWQYTQKDGKVYLYKI